MIIGEITMKIKSILSKFILSAVIAAVALSSAACSSSKETPVPADGYQLPYEYSDGYTAKLKTADDTYYLVSSTDLIGNKVVHFTTDESEEAVKSYYDEYFSTLPKLKLKDETDDTVGYYDEDKRLIMYNLIVWTADGKTNYKMGCEACENIEENEHWELA